jgi:probable HAF family extracellular repeat protein
MKFLRLVGLVTLVFASARLLAAPPVYTVTEIGSLGGNYTRADGINENGDIVGLSKLNSSDTSPTHAFLYRHATRSMVDLGAPGGTDSESFSINDSGTITGEVFGPDSKTTNDWDPRVWLTTGGSMPLDGSYPNGQFNYVTTNSISNTGLIVGQGYINDVAAVRAILYRNGTITNLGTLGGDFSDANAISSQGIYIAGLSAVKGATAATNFLPTHAFLYRNGYRTDLGSLSSGNYDYSAALGVNNNGTVVGYSWIGQNGSCTTSPYTPDIQHAFVDVNGGKMTDLGNLANKANCSSTAYAVNDSGEIVGTSDAITTANVQVARAFLVSGGQMFSLTFLDWGDPAWGFVKFTDAVGINCNGWIAVNGTDTRTPSVYHTYLLIPKGPLRSQCPKPM